jgi:hypothetical protein
MRIRDGSDKGTGTVAENLTMTRQVFRKKKNHESYTESQNSPRPKKEGQVKSRIKNMLIIVFNIKGIVHKEVVPAVQRVNSVYYRDVLRLLRKNVRRLRLELWRQNNLLLHHFRFQQGIFFTKNKRTVVPDPPYFPLFSRLEIKLKGRHFDATEVMETESQAVLNTLTGHDFQDAFKNGISAGNGDYFESDDGQ